MSNNEQQPGLSRRSLLKGGASLLGVAASLRLPEQTVDASIEFEYPKNWPQTPEEAAIKFGGKPEQWRATMYFDRKSWDYHKGWDDESEISLGEYGPQFTARFSALYSGTRDEPRGDRWYGYGRAPIPRQASWIFMIPIDNRYENDRFNQAASECANEALYRRFAIVSETTVEFREQFDRFHYWLDAEIANYGSKDFDGKPILGVWNTVSYRLDSIEFGNEALSSEPRLVFLPTATQQ